MQTVGDLDGSFARNDSATGLRGPSRRGLLGGAAALGAGSAWLATGLSPAQAADLPLVRPLASHSVWERFGIDALPNFLDSGYGSRAAWMSRLDELNVHHFRGFYAPGLPETLEVVRLARRHHLKWAMTVANDLETTDAQIRRSIQHIADHAADRCLWVGGINEPNWDRTTEAPPPDWQTRCVAQQRVIHQAVRSHRALDRVKILSPTLRDVNATEADYRRLADLGVLSFFDVAAIHRYPNGHFPDQLLSERQRLLARVWPDKEVWITETGYQNALAAPATSPVPEWVAGAYAPSVLFEAVDRGYRGIGWYELLDDPDPGAKDLPENNRGLYATRDGAGPPWRAKPAAHALGDLLGMLKDPGHQSEPVKRRLRVTVTGGPTGDLRRTVTAKRNGHVFLHLRRATDCYDPREQHAISVPRSQVRIATSHGVRRASVDHRVTTLRIY